MPAEDRRETAKSIAIAAWAAIGVILLLAAALWVLDRVSAALVPFIMAGMIVLVLRGPVNRLEKAGWNRSLAAGVCYLGFIALVGGFFAFIVPMIASRLGEFADDLPSYYEAVREFWEGLVAGYESLVLPPWLVTGIEEAANAIASQFADWSSALAGGVVVAGGAAAAFLFNMVLAFVIGFWALKDLPAMKGELLTLVGERREEETLHILNTVLHVLGGYIRGQAIVSALTGLLTFIGLTILGIPYALLLGVITGLLNVIPYIGPYVGAAISAVVAAFVGPWHILGAIAVTAVAQQVTDLFVTPRVMSSQVDLHPVVVIFSLLVGGTVFGFWGLLFAIPIAAIIKGVFVYYYEKHTKRPLTSEDGALFRGKKCEDGTDAEDGEPCASVETLPSVEEAKEEDS